MHRQYFRNWCKEMWFQYVDECNAYQQKPVLDSSHYFQLYKWWLKREFRHQNSG